MFIQTHHAYGTIPTFRALCRGEEVGVRPGGPSSPLPPRLPAPQPGLDPREPGAARSEPPRWSRALRRAAPVGGAARACRRPAARSRRAQARRSGRDTVHSSEEIFQCLRLLFHATGEGKQKDGFALQYAVKEGDRRIESREVEMCKPPIRSHSKDSGASSKVIAGSRSGSLGLPVSSVKQRRWARAFPRLLPSPNIL